MYTYNKKVLFSDVDATRRMSFGSLMDAMQDCVNINSESVGRGIDYMLTHKRTWFAISWNIEILRIPKMFEEISVKTWAYEFATSIGYRNVIVTDENGEDIVCAAITSAIRLVEATVNDVMGLCAAVKVNERETSITLRLPGGLASDAESTCQNLLTGLMVYLAQLHDEYPDNIEVMEA